MESYGRPLVKMPAEPSPFPHAETVITFLVAGLTAPSRHAPDTGAA